MTLLDSDDNYSMFFRITKIEKFLFTNSKESNTTTMPLLDSDNDNYILFRRT